MKDSTFEELYAGLIVERAKKMLDNVSENKEIVSENTVAEEPAKYNAHYRSMGLQPVDVICQWLTREQEIGFYLGNCIKYLGRFNMSEKPGKGGLDDLLKAKQYLNWLIERVKEQ